MRIRYSYNVDGGQVPSHHQPHTVEIFQDFDDGKITLGLNERFDTVDKAEKELLSRYDTVTLAFVQTMFTKIINQKLK